MNDSLNIIKNLTTQNFNVGKLSRIKYIVVHYTANNGDTALGNTNYFKTYRGASAHYFVDEKSIYQSVEDKNIAWHCGAKSYKHPYCRNSNSIGVELCSRKDKNGSYYFLDETVNNAVRLIKYLMAKYSVGIGNVIRHYDVTGKNCPEPFVRDTSAWVNFNHRLVAEEFVHIETEDEEMVTQTKIKINGKEHTVNRILKDGKNYICLADLNGNGFEVGYDRETKVPSIDNAVRELPLEIDGVKTLVEAANIGGYNFVPIRSVMTALGNIEIDYRDGVVIITRR